jgi:hypothetical protein
MDGVCPVCVVANTSVLLAAGSGADAVIAPEMLVFARTLGFRFRAHRVGHPDPVGASQTGNLARVSQFSSEKLPRSRRS